MLSTELFRAEALEAMGKGAEHGAPLALTPSWIGWAYRLIALAVAAGMVFVGMTHVADYAEGPGIVRRDGRLDLPAAKGGIVTSIHVQPGDRVRAGQVLVRFHTDAEQQELTRLEREFEIKLVQLLLRPGDDTTRQSLAALRANRELAAQRLRDREVLAVRPGTVRNLRIRPGQMLQPGDVVLTLVDEDQVSHSVVALIPGRFRPMLRPGMPMRFELDGYPHVASTLIVDGIGDEVVGPAEVRRYLGQELGDTLTIRGPVVLVHARMTEPTFPFEGTRYGFFDGISGTVEIKVRTLRLASLVFPTWKGLFRGAN